VNSPRLTEEQVSEIVDTVTGYANGYTSAMAQFDIEAEDLDELLANANIEKCDGCDWYFESGELIDDNEEVVGCKDCRPAEEEDE
jgi:hypothetical protein